MKIIEERYLKKEIKKLNQYSKEHRSFLDFFNNVDPVMDKTLQDLSFKSDLNFFKEIEFILSVITSIISHPHLVNKGEEIIVRADQANHVSTEMFNKTMRDSTLWKENNQLDMVPEYVYYYQQIDELRIYENIFICMLVKMIEQEINKYSEFYVSTILTFNDQDSLSVNKDNSDIALDKMNNITRRLKHIKNTYFYKTINRGGTKLGHIHPTNILTKDRLYNFCYKFYKKMITYSDNYSRLQDIRAFYYIQFIKVIKELGFTPYACDSLQMKGIRKFNIPKAKFSNDLYILNVYQLEKYTGLILEVDNKKIKGKKSKHLLLFDSKPGFSDETYEVEYDKYETVEILSLWNMGYVEGSVKSLYPNPISENEMMKEWITTKIKNVIGSKKIYSIYCPSCKSQMLVNTSTNQLRCEKCTSKYTFYKNENGENIWFNRLRRGF
jgi:hypothetical protein